MPAPNASRIATTASTSAPPSVDKAGTISSAPERTTMTAIKVVTSENSAIRRDQMASRDVGSSAMRRRTIFARFHGFGPLSPPGGILASVRARNIPHAAAIETYRRHS